MIKLDNYGHFHNSSFSKWLSFIFKVCTFSSCLLLHVYGPCQTTSLKIQTKNEMLTLHIVEIRVGRCPTWLSNWKQKYLVIWLETLRHFPQFLLLRSLLHNCPQQLYINETKTNNFPILSAFQMG